MSLNSIDKCGQNPSVYVSTGLIDEQNQSGGGGKLLRSPLITHILNEIGKEDGSSLSHKQLVKQIQEKIYQHMALMNYCSKDRNLASVRESHNEIMRTCHCGPTALKEAIRRTWYLFDDHVQQQEDEWKPPTIGEDYLHVDYLDEEREEPSTEDEDDTEAEEADEDGEEETEADDDDDDEEGTEDEEDEDEVGE